jgi:hypothetical protein
MRLSGLAVAAILLFSSVVVAQHSSSGSLGGSHSSYSGGGSSSGGSATHSGSSASHSSHQPSGSNAAHAIREPGVARVPSQPEKRTFFSLLRHPFRKPQPKTEGDLQRRICAKKGSCPVCPVGQTVGKNGACVASPQPLFCRTGEHWNDGGCVVPANFLANCSTDPDGELMAARRNMEGNKRSMEAVCSQDPTGHECSEGNVLYQRAVDLHRQRLESHMRDYEECQRSWSFFSPFGLYYGPLFSPLGLYSDPLLP